MSSPMPSRLRSATPTNNLSLRHLRRYEVQRHRRNSARENAVSFTSVAPNVRRLQTDLLAKSLTKAGCVGLVAVLLRSFRRVRRLITEVAGIKLRLWPDRWPQPLSNCLK